MLKQISIDNYVLIDSLEIQFPKGLSMITGETGAGKSILLGALSLILGDKAESGVVKNATRPCIVEAVFDISRKLELKPLLEEQGIEFEDELLVRRMVAASGKSRAFVNDLPAPLVFLRVLGEQLVDIHAQHENLLLRQAAFQLEVIDAYAGLAPLRADYAQALATHKQLTSEYEALKNALAQAGSEQEYLKFQWEQLQAAGLQAGEDQDLEQEQSVLAHAGDIKTAFYNALQGLQEQESAALGLLRDASLALQKVVSHYAPAEALAQRLSELRLELKDICDEMDRASQRIQDNPRRLEAVEQRLTTLYALEQKHRVDSVEALLALKDSLAERFRGLESAEANVLEKEKQLQAAARHLEQAAQVLSATRRKALSEMNAKLTAQIQELGMAHGQIQYLLHEAAYGPWGADRPEILFAANRAQSPAPLSQVASGGELSRIMLCIKSLMVQSEGLPTIIFDEIDLGVSGRMADKMGDILDRMSQNMQVIVISHLPQIAAKGQFHLKVYKEESPQGTFTRIQPLSPADRVEEIARLLSGSEISAAAIENAKTLLKI
jgi:DNA repair protein RecN